MLICLPKVNNDKKKKVSTPSTKGKRRGQRSKYEYWLTDEGLSLLEGWARDGATDEIISQKVGINPATLYDWKKKYPKIAESLKKGKEVVDIMVENALLKRALGYTFTEIKTEESAEGEKITRTVKEITPDTTAQIFWLKNRRPDRWRDKQDVSLNGSINTHQTIDMSKFSKDELLSIISEDDDTA